jgi:hypothetical protein
MSDVHIPSVFWPWLFGALFYPANLRFLLGRRKALVEAG